MDESELQVLLDRWPEKRKSIELRVKPGVDVNIKKTAGRDSTFRIVREVTDLYVEVPVGEGKSALEKYPWMILRRCWVVSHEQDGFTRKKLEWLYDKLMGKKPRPCSFHTIGRVLEVSGLVRLEGYAYMAVQ